MWFFFIFFLFSTDLLKCRSCDRNTRQQWPGWLIISFRLLSTTWLSIAEYNNFIARNRRWDSIFEWSSWHKIQLLAVLHKCHTSWLAHVDGVDHNWYVNIKYKFLNSAIKIIKVINFDIAFRPWKSLTGNRLLLCLIV